MIDKFWRVFYASQCIYRAQIVNAYRQLISGELRRHFYVSVAAIN